MPSIPLFVCIAVCLATLTFGIFPDLKQAKPSSPVVAIAVVEEAVTPALAPYHPRPVTLGNASEYAPPDFAQHLDATARKQAFYAYLLPKIYQANQEVILERQWLLNLQDRLQQGEMLQVSTLDNNQTGTATLAENELQALLRMAKRYKLRSAAALSEKTALSQATTNIELEAMTADMKLAQSILTAQISEQVAQLLLRVDVVPASLVIAQAAKESGWGRSRFAREGNNFFGIWCFNRGCGMTPERRDEGRHHEVAMFDTVEEGVRYYVRTINSHIAYNDLRQMRAEARHQHRAFAGETLATGLLRYSERGVLYVDEIKSMIRYNQLQRFTRAYSA
jgi:uncharacterized FlgJ-related protein